MNKNKILKIVNPLLGLAFIAQMLSGFLMSSLPMPWVETCGEIHEGGAWVLLALTAAHVWLNWGWVKANFLTRKKMTVAQ